MKKSNYRLTILDAVKGTKVKEYFDFYQKTTSWGREEINDFQWQKFKNLISYAYHHVPYYKKILKKNNLTPDSFGSFKDITKIPPLTREDIQNYNAELISLEKDKIKFIKSSSSGTTGIPITYYQDIDGVSSGMAAYYILLSLSGWRLGQKCPHIWGNPTSIQQWNKISSRLKRALFRQKNIASTLFNDESNYPKIIAMLKKYKFDYIDGYTHSIYSLAEYIKTNHVSISKFKSLFPTAENLLEYQRDVIEKVLGPVSDIYGCGEINGIAAQPINDSKYFIFDPHVYVETKTKDGSSLREILVTDLDNKIMPFIRYKVGDLIDDVYQPSNSDQFQFKYFKKIYGRATEIIDLGNGKKILPVNILGGTSFRRFDAITRHKVIWNGEYLHFLFEINKKIDLEKLTNIIQHDFENYNVDFKIEIVPKIQPNKNGKFRYLEIVN